MSGRGRKLSPPLPRQFSLRGPTQELASRRPEGAQRVNPPVHQILVPARLLRCDLWLARCIEPTYERWPPPFRSHARGRTHHSVCTDDEVVSCANDVGQPPKRALSLSFLEPNLHISRVSLRRDIARHGKNNNDNKFVYWSSSSCARSCIRADFSRVLSSRVSVCLAGAPAPVTPIRSSRPSRQAAGPGGWCCRAELPLAPASQPEANNGAPSRRRASPRLASAVSRPFDLEIAARLI